jgi:hypothetical protein
MICTSNKLQKTLILSIICNLNTINKIIFIFAAKMNMQNKWQHFF